MRGEKKEGGKGSNLPSDASFLKRGSDARYEGVKKKKKRTRPVGKKGKPSHSRGFQGRKEIGCLLKKKENKVSAWKGSFITLIPEVKPRER